MKQQKRVDKILQAVKSRVQEEVGLLLGTVFVLNNESYTRTSKKDLFDKLQGKQICAEMDISGDISGKGCLLIGIKDAIRLGGTLIMLPESELREAIGREEYSEEIEDSYGEIVNIIADAFSKDFEEMYPKSCRFVGKKQEILVPAKVEIESDEPVENRQLYRLSWSLELEGAVMGDLVMLLPVATFGLEEEETAEPLEAATEAKPTPQAENSHLGNGADVDSTASAGETPGIDFEKQKKGVDRLFDECRKRLQDEIGVLLGVPAVLSDIRNYFADKKEFFEDRVSGRQVIADMEVAGDAEDKSFFCISKKDAVHLGGVLIMLPPNEHEITVKEEDFGEDAQDAYGEIVNIVAGVYTAVFEEQHTKKLRFIKNGLSEVLPAKVETKSESPLPDSLYYVNSLSLGVDGKELGKVQMLFPAAMLDLQPPELGASSAPDRDELPKPAIDSGEPEELETQTTPRSVEGRKDVAGHQARVDKLLTQCRKKMQDEVTGLLGTDVQMVDLENKIINKENFFFEEVSGRQVIANMDVVGELEGQSFLSVDRKDAIRLGGVLIMLPADELKAVVADEDFGEDAADAFGEIANIVAGVYSAVFEEQYTKKIRFIKKELQDVAPIKVDVQSETSIPDQDYYVSSMKLVIDGTPYGKVKLLFPLDLLQLEGLLVVDESAGTETQAPAVKQKAEGVAHEAETTKGESSDRASLDILVIGDDAKAVSTITSTITGMGYSVKMLSFKDNIHDYIPGKLKAIYLVMSDVNEQGFGTAIKISAACTLPLIAAGPAWTRTKVIKAVKYGVRDILLTPASSENIRENLNNNLLDMAA